MKILLILTLIQKAAAFAQLYFEGKLTDGDIEIDLEKAIILTTPPEDLRKRGISQDEIDAIINSE